MPLGRASSHKYFKRLTRIPNMSQPIVINIGALPNDGTGDPLRTAFNDVNLNFANVFTSGPVGSNIQIANNIVSTLNTNGNLVLSPNGVGIVQANSHVVPNQTRIRNLGSSTLLWNTTYTQYLNTTFATIGTANIGNIGNLTIPVGNLHILGGTNGYVLQTDGTGNLTWTAQTGGSGNATPAGANTQVQYNNAGAFGGTAGFTFNNTTNALAVSGNVTSGNVITGGIVSASGNVRGANLNTAGNVTANYFIGNGSQLTGVVTSTGNIGFSGDAIYDLNGIYLENADLTQGATAAVVIPTNGSSDPIQVNNTYGNIALQTGAGSGITASWSFDNTGNLTLPSNSSSINYANGQPYSGSGSAGAAGNAGDIQINVAGNIGADSTLRYVDNGGEMTLYADYLNAPGIFTSDIYAGDGTPSNITLTTSYGNATWTFDTTGNLSIPGALNHYVVDNLANLAINSWTPIQLTTGDGVNTGYQNWTFDNAGLLTLPGGGTITSALGDPEEGLWLGYNGHRLLLNSDGQFWTGGIELGGNALPGYVGSYGNITLNANIGTDPLEKQWVFGTDGNLSIPGGGAVWTLGTAGTAGITANILDPFAVNLGLDYSGNSATLAAGNLVTIQTATGAKSWIFDSAGELTLPSGGHLGYAGKGWTGLDGGNGAPVSLTSFYANGFYAGCVTNNNDGNIIISTYTGNGLQGNWTFDNTGNLTTSGNISASGNITGSYLFGNGSQLTGVGAASVPSQTILPTIQSITITKTSSEYETSGGSGYANVLVANVVPVIEYGVIVTAGSTVDKYVIGNLANIPGTEKITISTGTSDQPFTVYAYVTTNAGTYYSGPEVGFSGLCLLKGTMISLADGTYKPIEDINNDDLLLTWDFDLGQYAPARPLWIKRGESGTRYNKLTFSDGTRLRTFDQHRIFNKQAGAFTYPMSDDTPIGTVTVNEHGQEITLIKRELIWDTIEHYNIITDHHINLFADSILTSCRFNNIYPITDMKFVKDVVVNRNLSEFAEIESRFVSGLRLQEQSFELAMITGYVNRLLATEVTESISI